MSWALLIASSINTEQIWQLEFFRSRDIQVSRIGIEGAWNAHEEWNANRRSGVLISTAPIKLRLRTNAYL